MLTSGLIYKLTGTMLKTDLNVDSFTKCEKKNVYLPFSN